MPLYTNRVLVGARQPSAKFYVLLGLICLLLSAMLGSA